MDRDENMTIGDLIPVVSGRIGDEAVQTVDARALHAFLKVRTAFKDWLPRRVADYGFKDGSDFCSSVSESTGGRPTREYHITLDMAKELAMVERNDEGKRARRYFIECERKAKEAAAAPPRAMTDEEMMARALILASERINASDARNKMLQAKVEVLEPKAEALDRISVADGEMCLTNTANTLGMPRSDLIGWMMAHSWVYRRAGNGKLVAYRNRIAQGYMSHKVNIRRGQDGSERMDEQAMVTPKGLARLAAALGKRDAA